MSDPSFLTKAKAMVMIPQITQDPPIYLVAPMRRPKAAAKGCSGTYAAKKSDEALLTALERMPRSSDMPPASALPRLTLSSWLNM